MRKEKVVGILIMSINEIALDLEKRLFLKFKKILEPRHLNFLSI